MSQMPVINDHEMMAQFAKNLWENYIKFKYDEISKSNVSFYMATVVAKNNDGTLSVQEPFDNVKTVTCAYSLRSIAEGEKVLVLKLGNGHNAANNLAIMTGAADPILAGALTLRTTTATNANSMGTTGLFHLTDAQGMAMSNLPVTITAGMDSYMIVFWGSSTSVLQLFTVSGTTFREDILWMRKRVNSVWQSWIPVGYPAHDPTWTAPTFTSNRATNVGGGFYTIGKMVHVQMIIKMAVNYTSGSTLKTDMIVNNTPLPLVTTAFAVTNRTSGVPISMYCGYNEGGIRLAIIPSQYPLRQNDELVITGQYIKA